LKRFSRLIFCTIDQLIYCQFFCSRSLHVQDEAIFEMTDIDSGARLLPVIEEDSQINQADTNLTDTSAQQMKPDYGRPVVGTSGQQESQSPGQEYLPSSSVTSALSAKVQADLQQIRDCDTRPATEPAFVWEQWFPVKT